MEGGSLMKVLNKLIGIGILSGLILAGCMKLVYLGTGNEAYRLLYNVDYFPLIHIYDDTPYFGIGFHYVFCIVSVVGLYVLLSLFNMQKKMSLYILVYTVGSGLLYFLTLLTNDPPFASNMLSWFYWTGSHLIYGVSVGILIKKWV